MEIDLIFKIAAVGIIVAILNQLLSRSNRDEYAVITTLAGLVIVVLMLIPKLTELFSEIREIFEI
ncbi:MAG: stage III sporulation protein AC [Acutalibacteraceae bacterium]|nr:stage III sporulation protein AC [Oscillospiraceae bacterium]